MDQAFKNVSLEDSLTNETSGDLLRYCTVEHCKGLPLSIDYKEIEGDLECPVCYDSLKSGRVTRLIDCSHIFCFKCIIAWEFK